MARFKDRERALALRGQEMSYSQIKRILKVSKSTLSLWLKDYPLSDQRIRELRDWNEQKIERCRETKRKKKEKRLKLYCREQKKIIFPLNRREIYIAGLFLYWGEGAKSQFSRLSVSNTDPAINKFFIYWLVKIIKIPKERIKAYLQLYTDMDVNEEIKYWSESLNIPIKQFGRPYIKKSSKERINHKGGFGHGTCNIIVSNARISERILMAIKTIANKYSKSRV